ncbi:MAG: carbohydrate ABC transporter permease [Monoglobaceae bacterium]
MHKKNTAIANAVIYCFLILFMALLLFPIIYTLLSSLKTNKEIMVNAGSIFPKKPTLDNYRAIISEEGLNLPRLLWNSTYYTVFNTITALFNSLMAGYVFARSDFPGKKIVFGAFVSLLFIQLGSITVYPLFNILNHLHLNQSLFGLMFIRMFGIHTTYILLIRSYVTSIPKELDEAAKIDGCGFFGIFWRIVLPLLKPIMATLMIMSFINSWNEYLMPTIFTMGNPKQHTLIVAITALKTSGAAAAQWNIILAGAGISMIPVLIVFLIGNKFIISGLSAGAVKG